MISKNHPPTALIVSFAAATVTVIISLAQCSRDYINQPYTPPSCEQHALAQLKACGVGMGDCVALSNRAIETCSDRNSENRDKCVDLGQHVYDTCAEQSKSDTELCIAHSDRMLQGCREATP